jgi:hypothetical protein
VPSVATSSNPRSTRRLAGKTMARLSRLATDTKTLPSVGRTIDPVPACDLANAAPKSRSIPITSPVERISGPSSASTPRNRSKGSTASFTAMCAGRGPAIASSAGTSPSSRSVARVSPAITRAATFASATPVAFEVNGIVREARGLASMQKTRSSLTAYCTFSRPRTSRPRAMPSVMRPISSICPRDRVSGGMVQAESPEWTPASSMCSSTPPTKVSSPSNTASTSTSMAPSRKRSTRIGWSGAALTASAR